MGKNLKPLLEQSDEVIENAFESTAKNSEEVIENALTASDIDIGKSPIAGNSSGIGNAGFEDINPDFKPNVPADPRSINCVNCAIATDRTLAGYPSTALPANDGASSILELEDIYNSQFRSVSNPADIVSELQDAGAGARGIVFGERINQTRGLDGHVFNAVNDGNNVTFIDGQNNSFVTDFSSFTDLGFMRTN